MTTQCVVAAAGRGPEASSEQRPSAQPDSTHARLSPGPSPSPPRPDSAAAAIFPRSRPARATRNRIRPRRHFGRGERGGAR